MKETMAKFNRTMEYILATIMSLGTFVCLATRSRTVELVVAVLIALVIFDTIGVNAIMKISYD